MIGFSPSQTDLRLAGNPSDRDTRDVAQHVGHLAHLPPIEDLPVEDRDRSADPVDRHGIGRAVPGNDDRGVGGFGIGIGIDRLRERRTCQERGRQKQ